jgi:cytochrome b involved in lipid metabolism
VHVKADGYLETVIDLSSPFLDVVRVENHDHVQGIWLTLACLQGMRADARSRKTFTLEDVAKHSSEAAGVWIVVDGSVYVSCALSLVYVQYITSVRLQDVTPFLSDHPGTCPVQGGPGYV